jgi:REP element-mobilizing transposase RayT
MSIEKHYPEVGVLATMVMPDHLHGILFVERHMEQHLGMVIKGFKTGCNKAFRSSSLQQHRCCIDNRGFLWERGYNDHIL